MAKDGSAPAIKGAIVLARHGEPALSRRIRLTAQGYRRWWAAYEEGGILEGQTPPDGLLETARGADCIFASTRKRALETAAAVVGNKPFVRDSVFIEAPLPPPSLPSFVRLKPSTWGFLARVAWWFFGHHEGDETKGEAVRRARLAADRLVEATGGGGDVLLLAHGFFNLMVGRELKKRGWRKTGGVGHKYWNTRRYVLGGAAR